MKISCYNTFASGVNLTQQTSFLAAAGFDAFELVGMHNELTELLPEIKSISSKGRISVSAICALHKGWIIDPDIEMQRAAKEDITKLLDLAGEIGNCGVFVIPILGYTHAYPGAPNTGRTPEDDRNLLIDQLSSLANRAKQVGTMIWLEVINRYESPVANTLAEGAAIIKAVNNSACLLTADFFHMNIEETDLPAALGQYSQFLGHIHTGDSTRTFPGFGHLDYPSLIRVLVANKYSGYLTVDSNNRIDPGEVLSNVAAFLKSTVGLAQQRIRFENEVF